VRLPIYATASGGDAHPPAQPGAVARLCRWIGGNGSWLYDVLLLIVVLGTVFGYELSMRALWEPDEGRYAEIPREMVASGDYVTPRLNGVKYFEKPPLFYWLQAAAIKTFGLNEWALRFWTACFALVGCLAVYAAGRRLYNRRAGLLAAGVLATCPLYDFLGGVLTLDMTVSVLLALALLAFLLGVREPPGPARRALLYAFYVWVALATLTKGLIGVVLPGLVIGAWIALLGEWRMLRAIYLPSGLLLFLAIAAPWHVLVAQANPEFLRFYFVHEHFLRYLTTVHQRYEPAWFFIPVLGIGMYPWIAFVPQSIKHALPGGWARRREHKEAWFLILWAVLVFAFFSASQSKLVPYVLPVFPPLALLLGRYFADAWKQPALLGRRRIFWLLFLIGAALAFVLLLLPTRIAGHVHGSAAMLALGGQLYVLAGVLLLTGLIPFVVSRRRDNRHTIAALVVSAALTVFAFDINLPLLDSGRSVKQLVLVVKPRLKPGDEVMSYHTYYQDLPLYLERRVTVVEWKGELEFGTQVEDTSAWMIDEAEFRKRWRGPHTTYLFTSRKHYDELRARMFTPLFLLAEEGKNVVLANNEVP